jgi:hypothetical protein
MNTMKKQIPHFIILMLCFLLAGNVYGQGLATSGAASMSTIKWPHSQGIACGNQRLSTEVADMPISYYDPTAPTYSWGVPSNWNPIAIIAFTERITLPSNSGFVDSVTVIFNQISGDSVTVFLDPDSVLLTPSGYYHLDETLFDPTVLTYAMTEIYPSQLNGSDTVTVYFPHVSVPMNFHVGVTLGSQATSFEVRGDTEATVPRTVENCHSTWIGVDQGTSQIESNVVDSSLTPLGYTSPLYSNLYITAYVQTSSSDVASNSISNSVVQVFPNPASDKLSINIPSDDQMNGVELRDVLGRVVLSTSGDIRSLDISKLFPGRYEAVINSSLGITVSPVVIQR